MAENFDPLQEGLFREVDEDIQREQMKKFWEKYGLLVTVILIAALSFAAGFEGWRAWREKVRQRDSIAYEKIMSLLVEDKKEEAITGFAELSDKASGGYKVMAKIQQASLLIENGKKDEGFKLFEEVNNAYFANQAFKEIAALRLASYLVDEGETKKIMALIEPMLSPDSVWRSQALEIKGLVLLRDGNNKEAEQVFKTIETDTTAPQSIRARAFEMVSTIQTEEKDTRSEVKDLNESKSENKE